MSLHGMSLRERVADIRGAQLCISVSERELADFECAPASLFLAFSRDANGTSPGRSLRCRDPDARSCTCKSLNTLSPQEFALIAESFLRDRAESCSAK